MGNNNHYAKVIPFVKALRDTPSYGDIKKAETKKKNREFTDYVKNVLDSVGVGYTDKRSK